MLTATVIVPTHNHGAALRYSVGSALAQTVADLDVLVMGDGVDDETREVALEIVASDDRVRFVDCPKGARHGEEYRHDALQKVDSRIVCYLADDDLWFPEHVETMAALLRDADFAHAAGLHVTTDGEIDAWQGDLTDPIWRDWHLAGENRVPLACAAHTVEAYHRLPFGWRTTPKGTPTDLYMWQQWLAEPWVRFACSSTPTVVVFPSPERPEASLGDRHTELAAWATRVRDERDRSDMVRRAFADLHRDGNWTEAQLHLIKLEFDPIWEESQARAALIEQLEHALHATTTDLERVKHERDALGHDLDAIRNSRTWRMHQRLRGKGAMDASESEDGRA